MTNRSRFSVQEGSEISDTRVEILYVDGVIERLKVRGENVSADYFRENPASKREPHGTFGFRERHHGKKEETGSLNPSRISDGYLKELLSGADHDSVSRYYGIEIEARFLDRVGVDFVTNRSFYRERGSDRLFTNFASVKPKTAKRTKVSLTY